MKKTYLTMLAVLLTQFLMAAVLLPVLTWNGGDENDCVVPAFDYWYIDPNYPDLMITWSDYHTNQFFVVDTNNVVSATFDEQNQEWTVVYEFDEQGGDVFPATGRGYYQGWLAGAGNVSVEFWGSFHGLTTNQQKDALMVSYYNHLNTVFPDTNP